MKATFGAILNVKDKVERHIVIAMVFLVASPILFYFYMQMQATAQAITIMELVEGNPLINLTMIVAFTNSLAGYLLYLMRKHVKLKELGTAVCLQVVILSIAQLLVMNLVFFLMTALLYHKLMNFYKLSFKKLIKSLSFPFIMKELSGSLVVLLLDGFCAFLMYRLMML